MSDIRRRIMLSQFKEITDYDFADMSLYEWDKHWTSAVRPVLASYSGRACIKVPMRVKPNKKYYLLSSTNVGGLYFRFIREDGTLISTSSAITSLAYYHSIASNYFVAPEEAYYALMFTTVKGNIQDKDFTYFRVVDGNIPIGDWTYTVNGEDLMTTNLCVNYQTDSTHEVKDGYTRFTNDTTSSNPYTAVRFKDGVTTKYGTLEIKFAIIQNTASSSLFLNFRLSDGEKGTRIYFNGTPITCKVTASQSFNTNAQLEAGAIYTLKYHRDNYFTKIYLNDVLIGIAYGTVKDNCTTTGFYTQGTGGAIYDIYYMKYRNLEPDRLAEIN